MVYRYLKHFSSYILFIVHWHCISVLWRSKYSIVHWYMYLKKYCSGILFMVRSHCTYTLWRSQYSVALVPLLLLQVRFVLLLLSHIIYSALWLSQYSMVHRYLKHYWSGSLFIVLWGSKYSDTLVPKHFCSGISFIMRWHCTCAFCGRWYSMLALAYYP
jgi:hypothetical protein